MDISQNTCLNCGNGFSGNYCNHCGEKVYSAHDKKLSHFFEEILHFITHFDTKFFRSVWLIFAKPGFVSKEFCEGKRSRYFKPVSLFLISIVIYLLVPLLQGMNLPYEGHMANNKSMHIGYSESMVREKMLNKHITETTLAARFNHTSPKVAKVLLLLLLPLSAMSLSLLFRNKTKYFFDHFILATEFNTFSLLAFFIVIPAIVILLNSFGFFHIEYGDTPFFLSLQTLWILAVLVRSFKRFYGATYLEGFIKSVLFLASFLIILFIYRQVTFIVVMLFI